MDLLKNLHLPKGEAICYSGYREGQSPDSGIYPSYPEILEDLRMLENNWTYLRLYDCTKHAETVLKVIEKEKLHFKVMLGAYIGAERNNFGCPWGAIYSEEQLLLNKKSNLKQIRKLIKLANKYPQIVFSLSAGNEATVDWTDHYVPVDKVIRYVRLIKKYAIQPVTFCDNYVPWYDKLKPLVDEVDFISIHTYPVWEYKNIHEAMTYTKQNFDSIAQRYPHKPVVITEAGWATNSNGRGISPDNVSEEFQSIYYNDLMQWSKRDNVLIFIFEAFDEPWKGSPEPLEPEKHWGLYTVDRKPKKAMRNFPNP
ncbi:MAG: glycosyl hydrolase [Porphyromonadaceae bacterium CG2_30_38_12]|nr:MAG: glycosyl hydrolase [Porphyromonadaceae bacterium CG2_30_38_12]